mgnify:CR=1 FL=1
MGGAELVLYRLLLGTDRSEFSPTVVSLTTDGPVADRIREAGVSVMTLGLRARGNPFARLHEFRSWLRRVRPAVVQSWMPHADLVAAIACRGVGGPAVAWGIRTGCVDRVSISTPTRLLIRGNAYLSHRSPQAIVCGSRAAQRLYTGLGYAAEKMVVIQNGVGLGLFRPDTDARASVRAELGIDQRALIVGLVGRWHPQKNHHGFFGAIRSLESLYPDAHFVLAGQEVTVDNPEVRTLMSGVPSRGRVHLLGLRDDIARLTASFDIAVVASVGGEGFPNTAAEAMACGIPCVVTDVGDGGEVIGDTGRLVEPGNVDGLTAGIRQLLDLPADARRSLGERARARVASRFGLQAMVDRYADLHRRLASDAWR